VYCELGRSFKLTHERKVFVETDFILTEIKQFFDRGGVTDYVTISGSGEPTLALNLGELIAGIKKITDKPLAVITNGVLLSDPEVRRELMPADVVMPSMDAFTAGAYMKVNRPHGSIKMENVIQGLRDFALEYKGEIWLEIMMVKGMNDSDADILEAKKVLDTIPQINKIQINTVVRSRAEEYADPVQDLRLRETAMMLGPRAQVIGKFTGSTLHTIDGMDDAILEALKRRPMTAKEFEETMGLKRIEVEMSLGKLIQSGFVKKDHFNGRDFYKYIR
jgi:wyosine [tRNA(Phe)-imidazoG37] synthetase (radical SAM superfamily)